MTCFSRLGLAQRPTTAALFVAVLSLLFPGPSAAQQEASFTVTRQTVETAAPEGIQPMTVTIGALSDGQAPVSFVGGAMEPVPLRTWFRVEGGDARSLTAQRNHMSMNGNFNSALFDGAEVEILRLENGRLSRLRSAQIATGGHQPSRWEPLLPNRRVLSADSRSARFALPQSWQTGAQLHVGLVGVDQTGRISEIGVSQPLHVPAQDARKRGGTRNQTTGIRNMSQPDTADSRMLSAPQGVRAAIRDGVLQLSWDAPGILAGLSLQGYLPMVSFAGAGPLEPSRIIFTEDGPAPRRGDLAILRAEIDRFAQDVTQASSSYYGRGRSPQTSGLLEPLRAESSVSIARLERHANDTPVPFAGTHLLRADVTPERPLEMSQFVLGPTNAWFRHPARPGQDFTLSVWARAAEGADVTGSFLLPGWLRAVDNATGKQVLKHTFALTPQWQEFSLTFHATVAEVPRPVPIRLRLDGTGTAEIDNLTLTETGIAPGHAPRQFERRLTEANVSFVRMHRTIKTGFRTYSLAQLAGLPAGINGQGLHPVLTAIEAAGKQPWLQVEPHFSAEEWQGLVEYLAAPWDPATDSAATKPYAALRVAQGRVAPWTDSFDTLQFELGNEMWNWLFSPWVAWNLVDQGTQNGVSRGAMLGAYQAYVMGAMSGSPYWPALAPRLRTVIGGWAFDPAFGVDAARAAARAGYPVDAVGIAAYNGGWDEAERVVKANAPGYQSLLGHALQVAIPRARTHVSALATLRDEGLPVPAHITYEAGPGYVLNGLNGARVTDEQAAEQETVMKSVASGTATLDTFLALAQEGTAQLNFFNFRNGTTWSSHAIAGDGAYPYPAWEWSNQLGAALRGRFLQVSTQQMPRGPLAGFARRDPIADAPLVGLYALADGDTLSVVALSRGIPGAALSGGAGTTRVRIKLPVQAAAGATLLQMAGNHDVHDIGQDRARLERSDLAAPATLPELTLELEPGTAKAVLLHGVTWTGN